jgi:hypothetical protein
MSSRARRRTDPAEHAPHNAMADAGEIARFYDRCSDLMRWEMWVDAAQARASRAARRP